MKVQPWNLAPDHHSAPPETTGESEFRRAQADQLTTEASVFRCYCCCYCCCCCFARIRGRRRGRQLKQVEVMAWWWWGSAWFGQQEEGKQKWSQGEEGKKTRKKGKKIAWKGRRHVTSPKIGKFSILIPEVFMTSNFYLQKFFNYKIIHTHHLLNTYNIDYSPNISVKLKCHYLN